MKQLLFTLVLASFPLVAAADLWRPVISNVQDEARDQWQVIEHDLDVIVDTMKVRDALEKGVRAALYTELVKFAYDHHARGANVGWRADHLARATVAWINLVSVNARLDPDFAIVADGVNAILRRHLENQPVHARRILIAKLRRALWWNALTAKTTYLSGTFRAANRRWSKSSVKHLRDRLKQLQCDLRLIAKRR